MLVIHFTIFIYWVPKWEWHAEEALARNKPVTIQAVNPILVAHAHKVWVEVKFLTALNKLCVQLFVRTAVL
ncbi:Uncharacterised protein [Chlamydia trachomatis]|nr:Uncharacterised protein [Chlamydia trachomatis]